MQMAWCKIFSWLWKKVIIQNNKDLNDIDINKIYTKLNDNLDFKFNDLIDDEENSD